MSDSTLIILNDFSVLIKTIFTQQYKQELQIITTIQLSNMFRPYSAYKTLFCKPDDGRVRPKHVA